MKPLIFSLREPQELSLLFAVSSLFPSHFLVIGRLNISSLFTIKGVIFYCQN